MTTEPIVDEEAKAHFMNAYLGARRSRHNAKLLWAALIRGDQLILYAQGRNGAPAHYQLRPRKGSDDERLVPVDDA